MRRTLRLLAVVAAFIVASTTRSASAQPSAASPRDHDEAVRLFQKGKDLRAEGDCRSAVVELEASVKLEESIGADYNLGACYEALKNNKVAYANYRKALALAKSKGDERVREIHAQLATFLDNASYIRLALPRPLPLQIRVTVDGDVIPTEEVELQGDTLYFPPLEKQSYEVRASAPGYQETKLNVDASAVKKKVTVTVVMRKPDGRAARLLPVLIRTKWGPFQFLGLGLIALGAAGMTYGAVQGISYNTRKDNFFKRYNDANDVLATCKKSAVQTCEKESTAVKNANTDYDHNEADARDNTALWLTAGIGGVLAVVGGVLLIVYGPRAEVYSSDPGATAKAPERTFGILPVIGVRQQGISFVGTF